MSAGEVKLKFAGTRAARMLAGALRVSHDRGLSQRKLAERLNYKQAVVLSHMSKGRVPVPLDRAAEIADAVGMNPRDFLLAAVEQRTDDAFALLRSPDGGRATDEGEFGAELALLAGGSLDGLDEQHRSVLREVVTDASPRRRWLSPSELPFVLRLRELRPEIEQEGLTPGEIQMMLGVVSGS